jgi:vitamin B12 transporter
LISEFLKPVSLGLGARVLEYSSFGTFFTYEINPSIRIRGNALLYFSFSTGFNAPSLYQLYSPEKDFMSGITRGNKNLRPEESSSWEIGIKQKVNNNLWWSISYFNTTVSNLIEYVYLWNKNQEINALSYSDYFGDTYLNLGKQKNKGIEFRIHSKLSDKVSLMANVSLVNGRFEYNPDNIDKDQTHDNHIQLYSSGAFISRQTKRIGLTRRPNTANLNFTYLPFEDFQVMLDLKYVGARNDVFYDSSLGPYGALGSIGLEDYTLLSCRAKYTILKGLSTMLQIENIFNVKYCDIMGYTTRGRGLYGSIRYTF